MVFVTGIKQATIFKLCRLIGLSTMITLCKSFGYPSATEVFAQRKSTFKNCIPHVGNTLIAFW